MVDGWAVDQAGKLFEKSKDIATFFKVNTYFYRQSGAIFDIYFTGFQYFPLILIFLGKFSRNFLATKIKGDNNLDQLKDMGYDIVYLSQPYPVFGLGGGFLGQDARNVFSKYDIGQDLFFFSFLCPDSSALLYDFYMFDDVPYSQKELNKTEIASNMDQTFANKGSVQQVTQCLKTYRIYDDAIPLKNRSNLLYGSNLIDS